MRRTKGRQREEETFAEEQIWISLCALNEWSLRPAGAPVKQAIEERANVWTKMTQRRAARMGLAYDSGERNCYCTSDQVEIRCDTNGVNLPAQDQENLPPSGSQPCLFGRLLWAVADSVARVCLLRPPCKTRQTSLIHRAKY